LQPGTLLQFPFPLVDIQCVKTQAVPVTGCLFGSCPASGACLTAEKVSPEARAYVLETKLMEAWPGEKENVLCCPRVAMLELERAQVSISIDDGAVPTGNARVKVPGRIDMTFQVKPRPDGHVNLELSVQRDKVMNSGRKGTVVFCNCLQASRQVKLGEPTKMVLHKDDRGNACTWVEVTVREEQEHRVAPAAIAAAVVPAPQMMPAPLEGERIYPPHMGADGTRSVPATAPAVGEMIALPPPAPPMHAQPIPMAVPSPFCPAPCVESISPLVPCVVTEPMRSASIAPSIFRAVKCQGEAQLEMIQGADTRLTCKDMTMSIPGCHSFKITTSGDQVQFEGDVVKASANRMIVANRDHLIMEGNVRLAYTADGDECRIRAGKVLLNLANGHLEIESRAQSRDDKQQILSFWIGQFR